MGVVPFRPEPFTDFSREENRRLMQAALDRVAGELGRHYPLIINGRPVETADRVRSINPSNPSQLIGTAARAGIPEVDQALAAARAAFPAWSATDPRARARILYRAAHIMRRRKFELSAWMVYEVGKPWAEADGDTAEAIDFLEFYGREMERLASPQPLTRIPGEDNELYYVPMGVGIVHSPFNFPLAILTGMVAAPVVAGNTVLVKPSLHAPVIAAKLFEILAEAGLPPGVVNLIPGDPAEIGDYTTTHPEIRFVTFTGSKTVGSRLYELAAKVAPGQHFLRRVVAEMGGKDAIIVDSEADLDEAAAGVVASAFGFSGQKCSACSRAIILDSVYDAVLDRIVARTRGLTLGPAHLPQTQVGPVVSEEALQRCLHYIDLGQSEGRLVAGGARVQGEPGYLVQPTVIADVAPESRLAQEEIFGPVLAVIRARDFDHALAIANGTPYALTGSVYSRNRAKLEQARREFQVGNLYLNRKSTGALVNVHPFGGWNMSGTDAKAGGQDHLLQFLYAKSVAEKF